MTQSSVTGGAGDRTRPHDARRHPEAPTRHDAFVELEKVDAHLWPRRQAGAGRSTTTDLRIGKGDFIALVGPSGCGKSTILKLVAGLIKASSGYVYVAGPRGRRRAGARRHGVPESDAAAVADDPRQRDAAAEDRAAVPAGISRQAQDRVPRPRRGAARAGRARGLRRQVSLAAVRRHDAARLALPRADPRSATADARRAVRRARSVHPRGAVGDHAGSVADAAADRAAGDPRPQGSRLSRQPHLRDAGAARPHHRRQRGAVPAAAHHRR